MNVTMNRKPIDQPSDQGTTKNTSKPAPAQGDIRAAQWAREHRKALAILTEDIERNGLWSDDFRLF